MLQGTTPCSNASTRQAAFCAASATTDCTSTRFVRRSCACSRGSGECIAPSIAGSDKETPQQVHRNLQMRNGSRSCLLGIFRRSSARIGGVLGRDCRERSGIGSGSRSSAERRTLIGESPGRHLSFDLHTSVRFRALRLLSARTSSDAATTQREVGSDPSSVTLP
jgi:hypothetical protein